jgi:hypothetical protein
MLRLILDESTQVTKSSMFLALVSERAVQCENSHSPRNQIGGVGNDMCAHTHMALLNELDGSLYMVRHAQPRHDDRQTSPRKGRHGDLVLDIAQLASAAAAGAQYAHVEQLLQHQVLVLAAEGVGRVEVGEPVGELAHGAAQLVVLAVVVAALDGIAAHHGRLAVVIVRLVCVEVDLFEQLLLVVLELADHAGGGCEWRWWWW